MPAPRKSRKTPPAQRPRIAVVHGPNLNLLGTREPTVYGRQTLDDVNRRLTKAANALEIDITFFQSNHEGDIIDHLHAIRSTHKAVVINPAGLTHTSVALRDALTAIGLPVFEVHLSNIHARESFRHHSLVSAIAVGVVCGLGAVGYEFALAAAAAHIGNTPE